jgi:hypothetical protein
MECPRLLKVSGELSQSAPCLTWDGPKLGLKTALALTPAATNTMLGT